MPRTVERSQCVQAAGREAFGHAMSEYSRRSLAGSADWETLADCFQKQNVPGFHAREFLLPWLQEKTAPRITARVDGRRAVLHQDGPYFPLKVDVEGTTANGPERRTVWMREGDAAAEFSGEVSGVRVDPDRLLLLKR